MRKVIFFSLLLVQNFVFAQITPTGCDIIGGMSNGKASGCGNSPNPCNLAATAYSIFGTFCGNTVTAGTAGHVLITNSYTLPAGCTATIQAQMKQRPDVAAPGCNNSGADGSDYVSIVNSGGVVGSQGSTLCCSSAGCGTYPSLPGTPTTITSSSTWNTGCSNADMKVRMVLTGGSFVISGNSDRGDEITTFTINMSGAGCGPGCDAVLPINLSSFIAVPYTNYINLTWTVETENDVDYYIIEKSEDGVNYFSLLKRYSISDIAGNNNLIYLAKDMYPKYGINYYRLSHVEKNGELIYDKTIVLYYTNVQSDLWINESNTEVIINYKSNLKGTKFFIYDYKGSIIMQEYLNADLNYIQIPKSKFNNGLYFIKSENDNFTPQKFFNQN